MQKPKRSYSTAFTSSGDENFESSDVEENEFSMNRETKRVRVTESNQSKRNNLSRKKKKSSDHNSFVIPEHVFEAFPLDIQYNILAHRHLQDSKSSQSNPSTSTSSSSSFFISSPSSSPQTSGSFFSSSSNSLSLAPVDNLFNQIPTSSSTSSISTSSQPENPFSSTAFTSPTSFQSSHSCKSNQRSDLIPKLFTYADVCTVCHKTIEAHEKFVKERYERILNERLQDQFSSILTQQEAIKRAASLERQLYDDEAESGYYSDPEADSSVGNNNANNVTNTGNNNSNNNGTSNGAGGGGSVGGSENRERERERDRNRDSKEKKGEDMNVLYYFS